MIALAHIAACFVLGAAWRRLKGMADVEAYDGLTFIPLCALATAPAALHSWGVSALALILSWVAGGVWLMVESNNGGDGHPLRRYSLFGLGYVVPPTWVPTIRAFGLTWTVRGSNSEVGELWLGGSWFAMTAAVVWEVACPILP